MPYVAGSSSATQQRLVALPGEPQLFEHWVRSDTPLLYSEWLNKQLPSSQPGIRRMSARTAQLSGYAAPSMDELAAYAGPDELGDYLGFSFGKVVKNIGKTVKKAVVDTGHVAGKVVTSTAGQALIGGALALTGVGLPAAIAIGAGAKGVGNLIKPGGNLRSAAVGAEQGALVGAAGSLVGTGVRKVQSMRTANAARDAAAKQNAAVRPMKPNQAGVDRLLDKPTRGAPGGMQPGLTPMTMQAEQDALVKRASEEAAAAATKKSNDDFMAQLKQRDDAQAARDKAAADQRAASQADRAKAKADQAAQAAADREAKRTSKKSADAAGASTQNDTLRQILEATQTAVATARQAPSGLPTLPAPAQDVVQQAGGDVAPAAGDNGVMKKLVIGGGILLGAGTVAFIAMRKRGRGGRR